MLNIAQWPTFWSWKRSDNIWDWLFYIFGVCGDKHCTWWMLRLHIHLNIVIWTCIVILVFPVLPCQLWPCGIHLKKEIFNSVIHSHIFCNDGHGWRICFGDGLPGVKDTRVFRSSCRVRPAAPCQLDASYLVDVCPWGAPHWPIDHC